MIINKNLQDLVKALTDEELCQAVKECNIFDDEGGMDLDSILHRITVEYFKNYYSGYLEVTASNIYKEAANRFMKTGINESDLMMCPSCRTEVNPIGVSSTAPANSYVGEQDWCMYTCPDCSYSALDFDWESFQKEIVG